MHNLQKLKRGLPPTVWLYPLEDDAERPKLTPNYFNVSSHDLEVALRRVLAIYPNVAVIGIFSKRVLNLPEWVAAGRALVGHPDCHSIIVVQPPESP